MTTFFRDQVSCLSDWFVSWNECEQVVTLYSLVRKITSTQARFLAQVLEHILQNCTESDAQESCANDPAYISGLYKESKEFAVSQLLKCLPLLKVGNTKAKAEYLNIMPMVMAHSIENNCHIEECRQLLSYSLIHPAISRDELAVLTIWMNSLEECHSNTSCSNTKVTKPLSVPPLPQNLLVPQYTTGSGDGLGNVPMLSIHDKSSALPIPNGISTRYLVSTMAEQTSSGSDWPTMIMSSSVGVGRIGTDLGTMSNCDQAHTGVIGSRNRALTSSASMPLSDGVVNHPSFISWSMGSQVPDQHLSNQTPYMALQNPPAVVRKTEGHQKLTRTASLVPQPNATAPSVSDWLSNVHPEQTDGTTTTSSSRLNMLFINPDQLHAPLSPQSSITSSGSGGSDTLHDDLRRTRSAPARDDAAMKDVSVWLKSLRLHKYSHLFQQITYDEMMNLTEEWLEGQGVTKGARNKIIISIRKLKERQDTLRAIEKDVMGNGNLKQAITDLRQLLNAPIQRYTPDSANTASSSSSSVPSSFSSSLTAGPRKDDGVRTSYGSSYCQDSFAADGGLSLVGPSSDQMSSTSETDSIAEEDIPGQMTRVLGKICTQLLVKIRPDCDCLISYQQLLDRCINHHAFTDEQKKKMMSWRQQIHRVWQFLLQKQNVDHHRPSFNSAVQPNVLLRGSHRPIRRPTGPSWSFGGAGGGCPRSMTSGQQQLGGHPVLCPQASAPQCPNSSSFASGFTSRPVEVSPVKQPLGRTQSAPIKTVPLTIPIVSAPVAETPENNSTNEDIHASLDSLCISMMEHALGN